ncbi:MAG: hydroxyisourate hydrolase [Magnetovibrio sp.]|nr:hydroxyisourate hydrolase [Magnetovibrio sp.]|tara:strand:+ start:1538 stop:1900 length:363 start_codon:yes stop_codon:yes gene_type:complete
MANDGGFLTTHILDTAKGCPAKGVQIDLYRLNGEERKLINTAISNNDGRTDVPMIDKGQMQVGTYELVFAVGDYFAASTQYYKVPFIDIVPIRFGIENAEEHYHVPLLASPYSYSTYRGS